MKTFLTGKELSILQSAVFTICYILLKVVLAFAIFYVLQKSITDLFLQVEVGELISTTITLILLFLVFRYRLINHKKNKIPDAICRSLILIITCTLGLRLLQDPFFRYENILFNKNSPDILNIKPTLDVAIKAIRLILLQSVFEELFFRRIIFKGLFNKYSNLWLAIIISSLLFSLTHLSFRNGIPTLLLGMISSYIYHVSNNIWYSILLHALLNLIWFSIYINPATYWSFIHYFNFNIYYWLAVILGSTVVFISLKKLASYKM